GGDALNERLHRAASRLHESLALGYIGNTVVDVTTAVAVILQIGGLALWWRRKIVLVKPAGGLRKVCFDLHHAIGITCLPLMLLMAATAVFMAQVSPAEQPEAWRLAKRLHTGHFGRVVGLRSAISSLVFVAQGLTGFVVGWRPIWGAGPGRAPGRYLGRLPEAAPDSPL